MKPPPVITADGRVSARWLRLVHSCRMALDYDLTIGPLEIAYLKFRRHERVNRTQQSWRHAKACQAVREKTGKDFDFGYPLQAYADAGDALFYQRELRRKPAGPSPLAPARGPRNLNLNFWPKLPKDPT